MALNDLLVTFGSCAFFMAVVAWISYQKTKGEVNTKDGYFLAGRGLTGVFIAGSMLLTNLSAEQLIGLNGSAFGYNMSSMAWEVTAGVSTICMALIFLPRYLSGAFTTLPEFLSSRFDDDVRRLTVVLFLVGYGLVTIPSVLYSGSIAVMRLFDVPALLNVSYSQGLMLTILLVGIVGGLYAVFGGLKAVAVSDTINGFGLLVIC
jgi:SSS family solute:Na+ symporter